MDYTHDDLRKVTAKLRALATLKETIGYQHLADAVQLGMDMHLANDRRRIGVLLGDISTAEHEKGRPMLSAIVCHANEIPLNPGPGFYECARHLGRLPHAVPEREFHEKELAAVFEFWGV